MSAMAVKLFIVVYIIKNGPVLVLIFVPFPFCVTFRYFFLGSIVLSSPPAVTPTLILTSPALVVLSDTFPANDRSWGGTARPVCAQYEEKSCWIRSVISERCRAQASTNPCSLSHCQGKVYASSQPTQVKGDYFIDQLLYISAVAWGGEWKGRDIWKQ